MRVSLRYLEIPFLLVALMSPTFANVTDQLPPRSELSSFSSERKLTFQCTEQIQLSQATSPKTPENLNHQFEDYSGGELGVGFVERIRSKSKEFYEEVVNNIIMYTCSVEQNEIRCVDFDSPLAAKDWEGNCIKAADHFCPVGTCERTSNCYWNTVITDQNRTTRFEHEKYPLAEASLLNIQNKDSYARGVAVFGIIGIFLGVSLLLTWVVYFVSRYCCCCLSIFSCFCGRGLSKQKGNEYRQCRDVAPFVLLYLLCLVGIVGTSVIAFIGNEDINVAISRTFYHTSGLVADLSEFLEQSRTPLFNIENIIDDAAVDAKDIFDGTTYVNTTASKILSSFIDFGQIHFDSTTSSKASGVGIPNSPSISMQLSTASSVYDSAIAEFTEQVNPIVSDIQDMLNTLEDIYENSDTISSAISSVVSQIDSFSEENVLWREKIQEIEGQEKEYRTTRQMAVLGIFILSFLSGLGGLTGILASRLFPLRFGRKLIHFLELTAICSSLLGSVAFILAGIMVSLNVLFLDACQMSSIITADFEPILGSTIARGANACFNNTNLAVAYNVTDKVDFQAKLDEGLAVIQDVNITYMFDLVLDPLGEIQDKAESITTIGLALLNQGTTTNVPNTNACSFNETYTKETILVPWEENVSKGSTSWVLKSTGEVGDFSRQGNESGKQYMERIYESAGMCTGTGSCCLESACNINIGDPCNSGTECEYLCSYLKDMIISGYANYLEAYDIEQSMTADLGVICPEAPGYSCPTEAFKSAGNNFTLVSLIHSYRENITDTAHDLVNLASTSVGDTMDQVQDFLCNMNVSFVADRYDQVEAAVCGSLFGGFAQVNWALWFLAILLELMSILALVLSTRLQGCSTDKLIGFKIESVLIDDMDVQQ